MKIKLLDIIILAALLVVGFIYRDRITNLVRFSSWYAPCEKPIAYSLGSFDNKFGLSKQNFLAAVKEAEAIWEKAAGKELFVYADGGEMKINLVYDYRQQATSKLESIGLTVSENKASYDELKAKYNALNAQYAQAKADYDARLTLFTQRKNAYDQEARSFNRKGGASKAEFDRLQKEEAALKTELAAIKNLEAAVNEYIEEINSLAVVLNRLADFLNLNVEKYNEIGASRGEEFTEGNYQTNGREKIINIYEFSSRDKLVRVLAHELGHALGLLHVADPDAIMYKLNMSANEKLTEDDLKELNLACLLN